MFEPRRIDDTLYEIPADAREDILNLGRRLDETPVLRLQPCDALPHSLES